MAERITGLTLVKLEQIKEAFYNLCKQYEHMGKLLAIEAKALTHQQFSKTPIPAMCARVTEQFVEMTEQFTFVGQGLDDLGGKRLYSEKKSYPKSEVNVKSGNEKEFVSNIKPEKDEDETKALKVGKCCLDCGEQICTCKTEDNWNDISGSGELIKKEDKE